MKLMSNDLQIIGIIELEHIIYQWNNDVNAKYAVSINFFFLKNHIVNIITNLLVTILDC